MQALRSCALSTRDITESVAPKRERRGRGGKESLGGPPGSSSSRRLTLHATVYVITRCRHGPTNILITAQYINYWPYNLAEVRRGISLRNVRDAIQHSTAIYISRPLFVHRPSSLFLSSWSANSSSSSCSIILRSIASSPSFQSHRENIAQQLISRSTKGYFRCKINWRIGEIVNDWTIVFGCRLRISQHE